MDELTRMQFSGRVDQSRESAPGHGSTRSRTFLYGRRTQPVTGPGFLTTPHLWDALTWLSRGNVISCGSQPRGYQALYLRAPDLQLAVPGVDDRKCDSGLKIVDIEVLPDSLAAQPGSAQPHNAGRRLRRTAIATSFAAIVAFVTAAYVSLASDNATVIGRFVPDSVAYESHVMLGGLLAAAGRWPDKTANQWVRAASHARSQAQLEATTTGLAQARAQSNFAWEVDDRLCSEFVNASANARTTITGSGASCSLDPTIFTHVEMGSTIVYTSRPPIGGPHYSDWYPSYRVAPEVVALGYWVHNLEHGAVVLRQMSS